MVLSAKVNKAEPSAGVPLIKKGIKKKKYKLKGPSIILLILLGFIFYSFGGQMVEMYNVRHEIKNIQNQMDELKAMNNDLSKEIEQLNSDSFIEREAREKLGLVKPGEKIILEAKPGEQGTTIPPAAKNPKNLEAH